MNLLMRAIFSLLLLFTLSIPVISDCVAMAIESRGSDSNLLIVFYVQIMPDDLVMQLHRF